MSLHYRDTSPAVHNAHSTGTTPSDSGELADLQRMLESMCGPLQFAAGQQVSDTNQTAMGQSNDPATDNPLRIGKVLLAMPYLHTYSVQIAGGPICVATVVSLFSHTPIGVRSGGVVPPNSDVLVWQPRGSAMAYILGVIPCVTFEDALNNSDLIQQGGNSGPKKIEAYRNILKTATDAHGFVPMTSGRPMDNTLHDYSLLSETGIGLLIDSFQTYLRVNEACGLFLNYFDSHTRLAGLSMDIQTYCEHICQRNDEGELLYVRGQALYPWEAVGMYDKGEDFLQDNPAEQVQLDKQYPYAAVDLPADAVDQVPVHRLMEYGGYLGQGFYRTLMLPARATGRRLMKDAADAKDTGLFQESLSLDGEYGIRSAKGLSLVKYPIIPIPQRKRNPEDAKGDDSAAEDNQYRFGGTYGEGAEHKVREWDTEDVKSVPYLLKVAGVMDMITRHFNWKSTHAFEYHENDYVYYDEINAPRLGPVEFVRGTKTEAYREVQPVKLQIDERYKEVDYYNTMSFLTLTADGSVILADGFGSQLLMTGGQIRLESTGDLMLMSAARVIALSDETIVRSQNSVDISSSDGDLRLKSERNMQLLAANSGEGGLLLESKGEGFQQDYENKIGEEVEATGIVLLSRGGNVSAIAKQVYLRSGVDADDAESTGSIIMDCANGRSPMVSYASLHGMFSEKGLGIWHGPRGQQQTSISKGHFFGPNSTVLVGSTLIQGPVSVNGSLGVRESIFAEGNIMALQKLAQNEGGSVSDSSKNNIPETVKIYNDMMANRLDVVTTEGSTFFTRTFPAFAWAEKSPGNTDLLMDQIGFSYRDVSSREEPAYGYDKDKFFLLETRWQQLQRVGLLPKGPDPKEEKAVQYQGKSLLPWPGKHNWTEAEVFLRYPGKDDKLMLFNEDGHANSRRGDDRELYEMPKLADWSRKICSESYSL